ncbi:hypothetical protein Forpi1262_v006365 [Fusarium oxysporum f. sp. raphani]|uniref:Uncharacterized protein n=1 Tax=Fusarium oxysporum f. sp. raphani TaxID=96318 RepID=A0A8J5PNN0_FUSOX|nr:hypothetical protein Forpi1262_v006365 [Fusarium oxysporum f. sp. raphani]
MKRWKYIPCGQPDEKMVDVDRSRPGVQRFDGPEISVACLEADFVPSLTTCTYLGVVYTALFVVWQIMF